VQADDSRDAPSQEIFMIGFSARSAPYLDEKAGYVYDFDNYPFV
jgi:hypothetical protein